MECVLQKSIGLMVSLIMKIIERETSYCEICWFYLGEPDCMDWSDEKEFADDGLNIIDPTPIFWDDHKCGANLWSCGDGECIPYTNRYIYETNSVDFIRCFSMREFNHMCELAAHLSLWTKPDGLCARPGYNDTSIVLSTLDDICIYLIRCAFSKSAEINCLCNGANCQAVMQKLCHPTRPYKYPENGIIRPWLIQRYSLRRSWNDKTPNYHVPISNIRCRGYALAFTIQNLLAIPLSGSTYLFSKIENYLCIVVPKQYRNYTSLHQYSATCWKNSFTFNGPPYAFFDICPELHICFSQYRIRDGKADCMNNEDEDEDMLENIDYCENIRKHRFQCSSEQKTCLPIKLLAITTTQPSKCMNKSDTMINGYGRHLSTIVCKTIDVSNECSLLRYYIGNSSISNSTFIDSIDNSNNIKQLSTDIPFERYCDTFWDMAKEHNDENRNYCQVWTCLQDQFRCRTGQCIPLDWVCDGEWDCSDASDEFGFPHNWTGHNEHLSVYLNNLKLRCEINYLILPFRDFCNFNYEYPCYRAMVPNPLNISAYRPCINISQLGDGIADCYGGLDERNTLEDCDGQMLASTLRCNEGCISYLVNCREHSLCAKSLLCSYRSKNSSWCNEDKDVVCLNGECAKNARCDGKYQCLHGEDEHWCFTYQTFSDLAVYRLHNQINYAISEKFRVILVPFFPKMNTQNTTQKQILSKSLSSDNSRQQIHPQFFYMCNRGFPLYIRSINDTYCACPPSYYGRACEYFADRISIITHLDLTTFPISNSTSLITVVVHLSFSDIVIDHHIFHINPSLELNKTRRKYGFYLLYPRKNMFVQHKQWRFVNRTDIITNHPYSVHFDIYSLTNELGSFHYPVYFDFLPVFRLATVLKFPSWANNITLDLCSNNPCNENSTCKPILNRNSSYYCSCKSGYSGTNCQNYHSECLSYCNPASICRPESRGYIDNHARPLCICPLGYFGPRCYIKNEACKSNQCGQNSTCYVSNDRSGEKPFICICSEQFYGDQCQYERTVEIRINMTIPTTVSNIQFYALLRSGSRLLLRHQQIMHDLPKLIRYSYGGKQIPSLGVLKIYQDFLEPKYFILYYQLNNEYINITTTPVECPYAPSIQSQSNIPVVFYFHQICKDNPNQICFYDSSYFCLCDNRNRAECFGHVPEIDQCKECFANGRCIKNNLVQSSNLICICPHCTEGHRCEFSLHIFGFTLDSLLAFDTLIVQYIYLSLTVIIFLLGFFNNYCSFVTFKRKQPRLVGVGNYLLFVTILSQCSLLILFLKFITIVLGSVGLASNISCKIINFLLSISTRSTYWLTSWITINRLLTVLYPTSLIIKNPRLAINLSLGTLLVLLLMHIHEILFYQTIYQSSFSISICVTNFHYHPIEVYNRVSTLIHYLLPFFIQIICTIGLLIRTGRSRARATTNTKEAFRQVLRKQLSSQKELFITPIIIIFSALPQTILSFSLACSQLSSWQRHILLITILLSYIPQILGFILYVLPSSAYRKEFDQTSVAKRMFKAAQT